MLKDKKPKYHKNISEIFLIGDLIFQLKGSGISESQVYAINRLGNTKERLLAIYNYDAYLDFINFYDRTLEDKLILIDSSMPSILAHALIIHYKYGISSLYDISNRLTLTNPLNYDQSMGHRFYEYKLKKLIIEKLLEIMPNAWTSLYNIQSTDNRNVFENNLLKITHLKTPRNSLSEVGKIYFSEGKLFFKLNLQIEFI